jgi:hypothetical protein
MIALARDLAAAGEPVLNLLFHSSEAIVGGSPYNRTDAELAAFGDRLERFFDFARATLDAQPATFAEFERHYSSPASPVGPLTSSLRTPTSDRQPPTSDLRPPLSCLQPPASAR